MAIYRLLACLLYTSHDGSATTLHDAIRVMAKYQLGRKISENDEDLIVKFLNTLSGEASIQHEGQ